MLGAQPALRFEVTEQNVGRISEQGGVVTRTYRYTNEGDLPLLLIDSKVSCSCTKVSFSKKPVLPGQQGEVVVRYDPRKQPAGKIYKAIQLFSNDPAVVIFDFSRRGDSLTNTLYPNHRKRFASLADRFFRTGKGLMLLL